MTPQTSKVGAYIEQRLQGIDPQQSARLAGYSEANVKATASRLEARDDVRSALRKAKREGAALGRAVTTAAKPGRVKRRAPEPDEVGGDTLRSPLAPWKLRDRYTDPLALVLDVMNNPEAPAGLRIQCAKDAMPYCHARKEGTKGDDKKKASKEASNGFKPQSRPSHLSRVA